MKTKETNEYYIHRHHAYNASCKKPIFGKWKMIKEFFRFLKDPACLCLEIQKLNNFEIKETQWFDKDWNLIDMGHITSDDGYINENGDLITERFGKLTKKI